MTSIRIGHWTKLGSAIRDARTERRWSQHELAQRAHVSRSWLAKVEGGHRGAELELLLRLFDALDLVVTLGDGTPAAAATPSSTRGPVEQWSHSALAKRTEAAASRAASWGRPPTGGDGTVAARQSG